MAVIGGLVRIEGAWVGAFAFILMQNYITRPHIPRLGFGGTLFGGSFNTIIGIIFLAIVLVSPDGLMGIWERLFEPTRSRRRRTARRRRVEHRRTCGAGDCSLESWVTTARESRIPSTVTREEGITR